MAASPLTHQELFDLSAAAVEAVEHVLGQSSCDRLEAVDLCENAAVRLRDVLINRLRRHGAEPEAALWRDMLERVNVAISLLVGVEYPAAGIQQGPLEQARDVLKGVRYMAKPP